MGRTIVLGLAAYLGVAVIAWYLADGGRSDGAAVELLNVSYDPTRELWREINAAFIPQYEAKTGTRLTIRQSHGGSSTQARAVIDGLEADVATLALWPDTDALRRKGLIAPHWEERLPEHSLPYYSTIVFVVRRGNPKAIHDWPDLVKGDVKVITPNPKTSGNGKISFLSAWGAVRQRGGSDDDAQAFIADLYRRVPVLDSGARGATTTFAQKGLGDVHLTWENEAYLEVRESSGELEIVYPPISMKAEPHVTVVDAVVNRRGTRAAAEAYLQFLYGDEGQRLIAKHHLRPAKAQFAGDFPAIRLFDISAVAANWDQAQERFFAAGGIFDRLYQQ